MSNDKQILINKGPLQINSEIYKKIRIYLYFLIFKTFHKVQQNYFEYEFNQLSEFNNFLFIITKQAIFHIFQKARIDPKVAFRQDYLKMTKKYQTKKIKNLKGSTSDVENESIQEKQSTKEKKIAKEPKIKETILSDIELQIVEMFSRSCSNGQIGVKFPQQKKKGMMRLMNFCFRTILQQVEVYVNATLKKEAHTAKCIERKEKTIFHLSSNYRYKHIQKSLLQNFKILCQNFVKYHSFEHLEVKFLQKFYKKVIYNEFSADAPQSYKNIQTTITQVAPKVPFIQQQMQYQFVDEQEYDSKPRKGRPKLNNFTRKYKKNKKFAKNVMAQESQEQVINPKKEPDQISLQGNQSDYGQGKLNKICIEKINIYFGCDKKSNPKSSNVQDENKKAEPHPYARMDVQESDKVKRNWTLDMESQLIDQLMSVHSSSPNIIIRNLMKKFGRNKLFVETQIQNKKKDMYRVCIDKFVRSLDGKILANVQKIRDMETLLRNKSLSKDSFIGGFIHDFFFKDVQAISVTILNEYVHKLSLEVKQKCSTTYQTHYAHEQRTQSKRKNEQQNLKNAIETMSKLVSNYTYDLKERA